MNSPTQSSALHPANPLAAAFDAAWNLLEIGSAQRKSAAHTPVLATTTADGSPDQRVLVLRRVERLAGRLRFHTDARSPKLADIGAGKPAHVLVYDPASAQQLRLAGFAEAIVAGDEVNKAWAASTRFARRCYMSIAAPGTRSDQPASGLPESISGREPDENELVPARANFALIQFTALDIDWLHLASSGHLRARFQRSAIGGEWSGHWLIP
jgi:pyridoxamine 5'-phosphate oxidase